MFKSTLYRILYAGGDNEKCLGLRKFLYEMHLANTGMHVMSIFVRLCNVLNCEPQLLLTVINSHEYQRQIKALVAMISLVVKTEDDYKRKMWRFGRIFDETFLHPLQTKACPELTYILASALKSEAAESNENILNIAQLADVGPEKRAKSEAAGVMIVRMIRKYDDKLMRE